MQLYLLSYMELFVICLQTSSSDHKTQLEELRRLEQEVTQLTSNLTQGKAERDRLAENLSAMQSM